jgi:hypothetical protein
VRGWIAAQDWAAGRLAGQKAQEMLDEEEAGARTLMADAGAAFASDSMFSPVREALRRQVLVGNAMYFQIYTPWLFLLVPLPLLGAVAHTTQARALVAAVLVTGLIPFFSGVARARIMVNRIRLALTLGFAVYWWLVALRPLPRRTGNDAPPPIAVIGVVAFFAALGLAGWRVRVHLKRIGAECHPYDALVLCLMRTALMLSREKTQWRSSAHSRRWIGELDFLALATARHMSLDQRIDRADRALRGQLRGEARRIAEGIRQLKQPLVTAKSADDVAKVAAALTRGMVQVAQHDRAALLASAPEAAGRTRARPRWLSRLASAAFFAVAAWLLPLVPTIAGPPHLAWNVRWALIVAAVTAFASPGPEASARINDFIGRSFSH